MKLITFYNRQLTGMTDYEGTDLFQYNCFEIKSLAFKQI